MTKKRKYLVSAGIFVAILLVAAITAIAASNYGTQSDPLVTLSYLNGTARTSIMNDLNDSINAAKADLSASFDKKISEAGSTPSGDPEAFKTVTLTSGQKVTCKAGTEIMFRSGSAVAVGDALVDSTSGTAVAAGSALSQNHMYMVTAEGSGLSAADVSVEILVRGSHTVG